MTERLAFCLVSGAFGGAQRVALSVARAAIDRGAELLVVSPTPGPSVRRFEELGVPSLILGSMRSFDLRGMRRVAERFREAEVTCAYTHTVPVQESILGAAARGAGARVVIHRHAPANFSDRRLYRAAQRWRWKCALRRADAIVCVADHLRAEVEAISGRLALVVPNGVEIPEAPPPPIGSSARVAFLGRLDPNKRVEDFIRAAELVQLDHPWARFEIIGTTHDANEYEATCRRLVKTLQLGPAIDFMPGVDDPIASLSDVAVLVLPSILEGHPLVILEAMALGIAVVACDVPGPRDIIRNDEDGVLVPPRSPRLIAAAVSRLLASPEERSRLGEAARRRVKDDFSADLMVRRLLPVVLR